MTNEEIFAGLKEIISTIRPSLDLSTVTESSQLVGDLGLDSLTILLLSLAIETKFNFKFQGQPQFASVGDVIEFIKSQVA